MSEEELKKMGFTKRNYGDIYEIDDSNLIKVILYSNENKITQIDYHTAIYPTTNNINEVNDYYDNLIKEIERNRKMNINLIKKGLI